MRERDRERQRQSERELTRVFWGSWAELSTRCCKTWSRVPRCRAQIPAGWCDIVDVVRCCLVKDVVIVLWLYTVPNHSAILAYIVDVVRCCLVKDVVIVLWLYAVPHHSAVLAYLVWAVLVHCSTSQCCPSLHCVGCVGTLFHITVLS